MAYSTITLYIYHEGERDGTEYAEYDNRADYKQALKEILERKKKEGKILDDADKIMRDAVLSGVRIGRVGFKKMMQALRRFDEVGISNELYDSMEEIVEDDSIIAVSVGTPAVRTVTLEEYSL